MSESAIAGLEKMVLVKPDEILKRSRLLKMAGKVLRIGHNIVVAIWAFGGNDKMAKTLWASKELATEIAGVVLGIYEIRKKPVENIAKDCLLPQIRVAAVKCIANMAPVRSLASNNNPNTETRIAAVESLIERFHDKDFLAEFVLSVNNSEVGTAAMEILDPKDLKGAAYFASMYMIRKNAVDKLAKLHSEVDLVEIAKSESDMAGNALLWIRNQDFLADIAENAKKPEIRTAANRLKKDPNALIQF